MLPACAPPRMREWATPRMRSLPAQHSLAASTIVMGASGAGTLEGMVMGPVSNRVVHLSPLPVTLVK